jgi:hypothetical protein
MNALSMRWSSELRQLLFIGVMLLTAVALSYGYVTTEGVSDAFLVIIGAGLLLAILVVAPVLLVNRKQDLD